MATMSTSVVNGDYRPRAEKIPTALDDVTPEWLTRTLQHRYPDVVVKGFEQTGLKNSHTTKLRLRLDLNDAGREAGIPELVCLKANWSGGFDSGNICALEAKFYRNFRAEVNFPAPRAYYADWDDSGQGLVVMEDLAAEGGTFGLSTDHLGIDGVAKGLGTLAVLHGAFWNSPKLEANDWLRTSMDTPVDTEQLRMMYSWVEINLAKQEYKDVLPKWLLDEPDRFIRLFDRLTAFEHAQTGPRCLVHGDSHQGNSYVRPNGERVWLDWQLVRKGRPWRDVTYFMLGALTIDERRSAARDLLRHYRECLAATGVTGIISDEDIWEQFRRWPVYGMQSWLANMDEWGQKGLPMVERFFTAAADLDTLAALEN